MTDETRDWWRSLLFALVFTAGLPDAVRHGNWIQIALYGFLASAGVYGLWCRRRARQSMEGEGR